MLITFVEIKNFRRLRACRIDFSERSTVFVGANNSGKTSAMDALILFLKETSRFSTRDFTLSNWRQINAIGRSWVDLPADRPPDLGIAAWAEWLPQLDIWLKVESNELHYVMDLIPGLEWEGGLLGVRLRWQPQNIENLYMAFMGAFTAARKVTAIREPRGGSGQSLKLWPKSIWDYLDSKMAGQFGLFAYVLDVSKLASPMDGVASPQLLSEDSQPLDGDPFGNLIKVEIINAQRGFADPNTQGDNKPRQVGNLSVQLREYYKRHLNPTDLPAAEDLDALEAIEDAKTSFDERLSHSFRPSLQELEGLNYPGFGNNPTITISSKISPIDSLNHTAAVQFELFKETGSQADYPLTLPEIYNGLGYQNLISMVFKLIRFRDEWMKVGKVGTGSVIEGQKTEFEPLHLVLVEEPEAHLHAQVQQVFIKKAYDVLGTSPILKKYQHLKTQLVVSTHSNHIAYEIPFSSLRYFKRRVSADQSVPTSTVVNLSTTFGSQDETTKFAIRYLRTTHCDLFFADAVILIEGPAERILVPHFIRQWYPRLDACYLAVLEIGGSHSHTIRPLLQDLGIITLVLTDIDSVDPTKNQAAVLPQKEKGYATGNYTLKTWLPGKTSLDDLMAAGESDKAAEKYPVRVSYQGPVKVQFRDDKEPVEIIPYTFEIALAFANLELLRSLSGTGLLGKFSTASGLSTAAECNEIMFDALNNAKKTAFALDLLYVPPDKLIPPAYIAEGLEWLQEQLIPIAVAIAKE